MACVHADVQSFRDGDLGMHSSLNHPSHAQLAGAFLA